MSKMPNIPNALAVTLAVTEDAVGVDAAFSQNLNDVVPAATEWEARCLMEEIKLEAERVAANSPPASDQAPAPAPAQAPTKLPSKSEVIRQLARLGTMTNYAIAKQLGLLPQHVNNVVRAMRQKDERELRRQQLLRNKSSTTSTATAASTNTNKKG
jgi:DNA-binding NarL/FixJ family response regulator